MEKYRSVISELADMSREDRLLVSEEVEVQLWGRSCRIFAGPSSKYQHHLLYSSSTV